MDSRIERLSDPKVYKCASVQSQEKVKYVLDTIKYKYCADIKSIINDKSDKQMTLLDKCFADRKDLTKKP
jgi:hypothetical protein